MSIPEPETPKPRQGPIQSLLRAKVLRRWTALALIVVSAGDMLMTHTLLQRHVKFYESNPIAGWVLHHWDIAGMTVFKFGLVAFIILVSEIIERYRPGLGRLVMLLGIVGTLYAIVVGYGLLLEHG